MRAVVIQSEERWASAIRSLLNHSDVIACGPDAVLRNPGLVSVAGSVFVCAADITPPLITLITSLRPLTDAPLLVLCDRVAPDWEEDALAAGADHVFGFPLRARLIAHALRRRAPTLSPGSSAQPPAKSLAVGPQLPRPDGRDMLSVLRDLSRTMMHAADGPLFIESYLTQLRDVMGSGRLILFITDARTKADLGCAYATGTDQEIFSSIRLRRGGGVARLAEQRSAVVHRGNLRSDVELEHAAARELDLFNCELGVPLLCRDGLMGMLFVGGRIAGPGYTDGELIVLFHLMEEMAGMIRAQALHTDLLRERALFSSVFSALPIGCAVVTSELDILHANPTIFRILGHTGSLPLKFEDLPQSWATVIYGVLQSRDGTATTELRHSGRNEMLTLRLTVVWLQADATPDRKAVLLTVADVTSEKRTQADFISNTVRALMERAGEQLSNEFRNALTPVSALVHLSGGHRDSPDLSAAVIGGMHRLRRRVDELAYLARRALVPEPTTVSNILQVSRERVESLIDAKQSARISWPRGYREVRLSADAKAVGLALAELVLNGAQAATAGPVKVSVLSDEDEVGLIVRNESTWSPPDDGSGFGPRSFVTEKAEGVGIGLAVARAVSENHGGHIALIPTEDRHVEAVLRLPLHRSTSHNP